MSIKITKAAIEQINLILTNDYTINDKSLFIQVDGKECQGFTYSIFFSHPNKDSIELKYSPQIKNLKIFTNKFTAYYLKNGTLDYFFNPETDQDGLIIINEDEEKYQGKFWKENPQLEPNW